MPSPNSTTSAEVRAKLVDALKLDLVGPWPGHSFANELLPENPNRWYLTGYLVPEDAPVQHRSDAEAKDEMDAGGEGGGTDIGGRPDKSATLAAYGWTDLLPKCTCEFLLDYEDSPSSDDSGAASDESGSRRKKKPWRYRWPDEVRDEVLARLLKLNAECAEQERLAGLAAGARLSPAAAREKAERASKKSGSASEDLFG